MSSKHNNQIPPPQARMPFPYGPTLLCNLSGLSGRGDFHMSKQNQLIFRSSSQSRSIGAANFLQIPNPFAKDAAAVHANNHLNLPHRGHQNFRSDWPRDATMGDGILLPPGHSQTHISKIHLGFLCRQLPGPVSAREDKGMGEVHPEPHSAVLKQDSQDQIESPMLIVRPSFITITFSYLTCATSDHS